jgi:hypothetical protein
VALSPRANYTDRATATYRRNLVPTFVDRGVSRGQRGGSPTVVNLSFLDRIMQFNFVSFPIPSCRTMSMEFTQPLIEMSTRERNKNVAAK